MILYFFVKHNASLNGSIEVMEIIFLNVEKELIFFCFDCPMSLHFNFESAFGIQLVVPLNVILILLCVVLISYQNLRFCFADLAKQLNLCNLN